MRSAGPPGRQHSRASRHASRQANGFGEGVRRAWSGSWAGLCNTHFWVDRSTGICASIYSNFLPFVTPEAVRMYNDFERALYASL